MPFSITGARYASASISAVGTTTVQVGSTPFVQADFTKQRLVGLWSAASQVITNPGFDSDTAWTKGAGVTINGGVANISDGAAILSQNVTLVVGRTYTVSIGYTMTAGVRLRVSNSTSDWTNVVFTSGALAASDTITTSFVATGNGFSIGADGATFSGTIDNITVTEAAQFKGMAWVRRWVSTSQLQLERPFFDPATGLDVAQAVGDQVLVSKDFTESVVAGLAVSDRVVTLTDTCTFGIDDNQMGVCFYDESRLITATSGMLLSGGLTVFGKLDDYATNAVSSPISIASTVTNPLLCNNASVNFCGYGGRYENTADIISYFIGGNNQGTAGQTVILNGVECPNDLLTNNAGGNWARNPTRHQLVNCYTATGQMWSIMRRWGDGIQRGGRAKFLNNADTAISVFGSDSAGTYSLGAPAGGRFLVSDMGSGGPALVRADTAVALTYNFTNLITTDFRSVTGGPGGSFGINTNGTNRFFFSDPYTGLQPGTVGVILNNAGAVADSVASSGTSWSPSLLRRTCVGATVTVNATSWTFGFKDYGFQAVGGTITPSNFDLGAAGAADDVRFGGVVTQLADPAITLTQAQAAALTTIATLDNLYDAAIGWNVASVANAQWPSIGAYPVAASGTVLDLGNRNLVIDGTAGAAFAVNTGTNTITIRASALAAGTKFRSLATTDTVTFANGGSITAPFTDANNAGQITITGPASTDTVEMRKASDNSLIATRTGPGAFAVSPASVGVSVYFERKVGAVLVMSTQTTAVTLSTVNEDVPMFAGPQVAVANVDNMAKETTLLTRASKTDLNVVNEGVKNASLLIPHSTNLT